jgi:hypothetical protein
VAAGVASCESSGWSLEERYSSISIRFFGYLLSNASFLNCQWGTRKIVLHTSPRASWDDRRASGDAHVEEQAHDKHFFPSCSDRPMLAETTTGEFVLLLLAIVTSQLVDRSGVQPAARLAGWLAIFLFAATTVPFDVTVDCKEVV